MNQAEYMMEEQIILLAKQGNENAFQQLFENHREMVYRLAYRYSKSQDDAEDILQETFIRAFKKIKSFKNNNESSFSSWLYRICFNCSINFLRSQKSRKMDEITSLSEIIVEPESQNLSPEKTTEISSRNFHIQNAIKKLTHKQRIIFDLRFSQQKKIKEIGEIFGCSESNIKTQIFRSLAKLRKQLQPIWSEL
jgi:RNA polymerase sigma factor (sigma-70 family)